MARKATAPAKRTTAGSTERGNWEATLRNVRAANKRMDELHEWVTEVAARQAEQAARLDGLQREVTELRRQTTAPVGVES